MNIKHILSVLLCFCMAVVSTVARAESYVTYYHNDLLGSPVAATDEGGNLLWRESYKPFGEKIINDDSGNTVGYTGHQFDKVTELVYMQARYYDPVIGRFMGIDPVGFVESNPMSFNRYAYANNNPYRYIDPDGNIPVETVWDIANVGMGVVSFSANVAVGNYWGATLDAVGVVADGVATVVPYVPGGAGTAIKGYRASQKLKAATKRPGSFRKKTVKDSWDNAADGSKPGTKQCPTCGKDVEGNPHLGEKRNGPNGWDNDHQPKWKDRDLTRMDRKQVLDEYNKDTRLRCPSCNRADN